MSTWGRRVARAWNTFNIAVRLTFSILVLTVALPLAVMWLIAYPSLWTISLLGLLMVGAIVPVRSAVKEIVRLRRARS